MALGSIKLEGSYIPFCDGWKSMAHDHGEGGPGLGNVAEDGV